MLKPLSTIASTVMNKVPKTASLYAADDDSVIRELIGYYATRSSINHKLFETGDALVQNLEEDVQVCLLDLDMPGSNGLQCLEMIKARFPQIEVIILTSNNEATEAMDAIRKGAFDYVTKPFDPEELINCIRNAKLLNTQNRENTVLRSSLSESNSSNSKLLGKSNAMRELLKVVSLIAETPSPVLITGESGTGKTLLARHIHSIAQTESSPFVCVSCPSIPKDLLESEMFGHEKGAFSGATSRKLGKIELANKGTLFLDEIGELPLPLQAKLLNVLQDKSFYRVGGEKLIQTETRIIAATNQNLKDLVAKGLFREDLFFRLNVLPVEMPSLHSRMEDLPILFEHFLNKCATDAAVVTPTPEPELMSFLQKHSWPGNVRELEHAVTRGFTLRSDKNYLRCYDFQFLLDEKVHGELPSETSQIEDNHAQQTLDQLIGKPLVEIEKVIINQTIEFCSGNKTKAAKVLGIAEKSIYNKLKKS